MGGPWLAGPAPGFPCDRAMAAAIEVEAMAVAMKRASVDRVIRMSPEIIRGRAPSFPRTAHCSQIGYEGVTTVRLTGKSAEGSDARLTLHLTLAMCPPVRATGIFRLLQGKS